ncbi:hypothetical protein KIH39_25735 [Telmatocola sphagniphila]|jgi:membrane-bound serine protease (ClpP class)|uniref:NfeD-like C-terminal domain-containing protein n=1 Tax=Telmatocola sphagniphila TaxID=1123043 RepID=A0A8E6B6R6_9BACT|nr:NfeD family protein [Telmatocola sphagniphila]QVL32196.1 hypothetical protein KIH39_25735 [Telmatocola sphagniphila]
MDNVTLAFVLIACGLLLMMAEMFMPTGGIFFIFSAGCILTGLTLSFLYGETYTGIATLIAVFVLVPAVSAGMIYWFPATAMGDRLQPPTEETSIAHMAGLQELDQYKGRVGKSSSALRPSGVVDFDGNRIDCVSEGMMIEPGQWVRCIDVKSGRVIVRQIDKPATTKFEHPDFE